MEHGDIKVFVNKWIDHFDRDDDVNIFWMKQFLKELGEFEQEEFMDSALHDFPEPAFTDLRVLNELLPKLPQLEMLLALMLQKRWRCLIDFNQQHLWSSPNTIQWFKTVIHWIQHKMSREALPFEGTLTAIKITSLLPLFGANTMETKQVIEIQGNGQGRISFYSDFIAKYKDVSPIQQIERVLDDETLNDVFNAFDAYFTQSFEQSWAIDAGSWEVTLTNDKGNVFNYQGALGDSLVIELLDLSDLVRDALGIGKLLIFDGKSDHKILDYLEMDFQGRRIFDNDESLHLVRHENSSLSRQDNSLNVLKVIGSDYEMQHQFHSKRLIRSLMNQFSREDLFAYFNAEPQDLVIPSQVSESFVLRWQFRGEDMQESLGRFDRYQLPTDWMDVAYYLYEAGMDDFNLACLNPFKIKRARRRPDQFIYCSVRFEHSHKTYYYLTEDDLIDVGDVVVVPVGKDFKLTLAMVEEIEYFEEDNVPFAICNTKWIDHVATAEEIKEFKDNDSDDDDDDDFDFKVRLTAE